MSKYSQPIIRGFFRFFVLLLVKMLPKLEERGKLEWGLAKLANLAQTLPYIEDQREQLVQIEEAFRKNPAVQMISRRAVRQLDPKFLRCIVKNLWMSFWEGGKTRREFLEKDGFEPPSLVVISPLKECNLQCTGCYANASRTPETERLNLETVDRIVKETESFGTHFIVLSGGEPTHPRVWEDIKKLCASHKNQAFMMYTNGTLLDDKKVQELLELGNLSPALSLEGWEEETDARRGLGTYQKVMKAMERLRQAGVLFGFSLTYTRKNFKIATDPSFIEDLMQKGCLYGWYFMYVPVGKNPELELVVTPEERNRIRQFTWDMLRHKGLFIADFWNSGAITKGCLVANYLHVSYQGNIEPCVFFKFTSQNIAESTILDALRSPLFQAIRQAKKSQKNPLTPCQFMDHPLDGKWAVESSGARPSEPGVEALFEPSTQTFLEEWSREYRERFADPAWSSGEYAWFRDVYNNPERWDVL